MALEDFMESQVAVAVAATAAVLSPRVRRVARRGAVLGVAGAMRVADTVSAAARDVAQEAQTAAGADGGEQAPEAERSAATRSRTRRTASA
jgi:hypothetical protein